MAEARSAVLKPRVHDIEEGRDTTRDFLVAFRRSTVRSFYRIRNQIKNGLWPTSLWNLGGSVAVLSTGLIYDPEFLKPVTSLLWRFGGLLGLHEDVPYYLRVFLISGIAGTGFFFVLLHVRRYTLRALLAYRGWMYQPPRTQSYSTIFWAVIVRLVSGRHPSLYSCQRSLPRMPVPPLKKSLKDLIASLKPLYGEHSEEIQKLKEQSKEFEKGIGKKLQHTLILKSWWADNWVTDWWNKYVYLSGRSSLSINSNYYILDQSYWCPTDKQSARAAVAAFHFADLKQKIDREQVEPLVIRGTIPLCMAQYGKACSTVRVPGEDCDELITHKSSKHIVVMRKGLFYQVDMYDANRRMLNVQTLEKKMQWIMDDADKHEGALPDVEKNVAALTGLERTDWAKLRQQHFSSGINKESIEAVDRAMFLVVLEHRSFEPTDFTSRSKFLLHGDGKTLWFDKSITMVIFSNAKLGLNCEHSWGDAPVMGHFTEYLTTSEGLNRDQFYDDDGHCRVWPHHLWPEAASKEPVRLLWEVEPDLGVNIDRAISFNQKNNEDLDLCVRDHQAFGKGAIKKFKVSPDAFVQLAIQLAYYRDSNGQCALTYESSMTRLYLEGRTETVRSLTKETVAFVKAMSQNNVTNEEKISLLRVACDRHQQMYRDAMNGKGCDRHLFALYVLCKGLGYESEFLKSVLTEPWTLSTSQQPQQQIATSPDANHEPYLSMLSPGGGFGPVSDEGYGVSYMIPAESKMFFHISAKKSCPKTDAKRFTGILFEALADMGKLIEEHI
ncbi:carnitine O-palmitoyltransferase 1, liver isoform [Lingula anatina]|uniref:Carnitine O-palmitoyltransferase 1, liver isoform n=1 Tax=Lingula anatina TaxID=7574 RepID=A0A1S3JHC7_LINAN|nr:carnitine O-palmitoyltransferase 1, liver isoform [Lingula anatina]|eukprot:XP_013409802.1 carnitine O-palmitoyltransferase 1, liver isoform [Lingula anatina]